MAQPTYVPLPTNVSFGTVTGRFLTAVADSPTDSDRDPEGSPATDLSIRFTPNLIPAVVRDQSSTPPTVFALAEIVATVGPTGDLLGPDGQPGIRLVATTGPGLDPTGWTWRVTLSSSTFPALSFSFSLDPGTSVDLATVVQVPASPGATLAAWLQAVADARAARDAAVAAAAAGSSAAINDSTTSPSSIWSSSKTSTAISAAVAGVSGGGGTSTPSAGDLTGRLPGYGQPPTSFVLEPAPSTSTVVAGDDFTGTASSPLAGRSSTLGTAAAWSVVSGTWQIDGAGNVSPTSASDGSLAVITAVPAANAPAYTVDVSTVYSFSGAGVGNSPALVVRYVDASNFWYLSPQAGIGYVSVYQVQSGTHTERARFPFPGGLTSGATVTYRIDVWQEDLTFFVNGVEQATFTSPTTGLGSRVIGLRQGISGAYGTPAKWSNLRVSTYKGTKYTFPRLANSPSTQILARGATGTWDDADLNNPNVVWDPVNSRWVLYYSGFQSGSPGVQQGLGLAYASSLTGTWTKDPANPIVTQAGGNVENGALAWTAGRWLRATEQQSGATFWQTSPDLITWASVAPVGLTRGVHDPFMRVNQNGLLELWYGSGYPTNAQIFKATSTDGGLSWSDGAAPVLGPPPLGNGTYRGNGEPSVYALPGREGVELVILTDVSSPTGKGVICAAITTDGGQTWHWRNVAGGSGSGFDSFQKFDSNPVFAEGQFHVFHSGGTASGDGVNLGSSIGRMSSPWTPNPRSVITVAPVAATVPDAPTGVQASAASGQVSLTWTAPAGNGAAITDYKIEYLPAGGAWAVFTDGVSTATAATVTGLTNGTGYTFRVSAINSVGTGPTSATVAATPAAAPTVPGAPTGLTATPGNAQAALSWTAPASTGGATVTDYVVQYSANGGTSWTTFADGTSAATTATVTGLTNATAYTFQVAAVNSAGTGPYSGTASATPAAPAAPSGITDTFTRANSTTTLGTTETGGKTWQAVNGTWGISSNQAYNAGGTSEAVAAIDLASATHTIEARINASDSGTMLLVRLVDSANFCAVLISAGVARAYVRSAGSFSTPYMNAGQPSVAAGDLVKLSVSGTTGTFSVNGVQKFLTDFTTGSQTATKAGFRADTSSARWDDVTASAP